MCVYEKSGERDERRLKERGVKGNEVIERQNIAEDSVCEIVNISNRCCILFTISSHSSYFYLKLIKNFKSNNASPVWKKNLIW